MLVAASLAAARDAPPAAEATASISNFLPELQRLSRASDWPAVERLARQAMSAFESRHGDDADLAAAYTWLGTALEEQTRYQDAEPFYRKALASMERAAGPRSPNTAQAVCEAVDGALWWPLRSSA